ncbi:uncharacterized conserved protein (DUF2066) [Idiomarina sp. A28L]|uniref:DUF2066 domain-containing protein n=1 Tax=Idiomarina sp. A28L TaxID=1036674 RepID=UPI0002138AC6|nr:DUF2066 domain-containing protein [Idiomarina sp. A28L]EGN75061.1 uncharacterized conserved protein (DUF2066) [Idiomarina sp. A28L]
MRYLMLIMIAVAGFTSSASPAQANNTFADLLRAETAVANQTRAERQRELPNLFRQVLVRASGTTQVLENSIIRNEISSFNDYLLQFGYQGSGDTMLLQASFDERRIRELLQRAGFPVWTGDRPQLLLWVAESSADRGVRLVGRAEERPFLDGLYSEARRRGIRMLMPLMDLEDQMAIGARDVWGRFQREVMSASARYPVAGVVSARMYTAASGGIESVDTSAENEPEPTLVDPLDTGLVLETTIIIGDMEFIEYVTAADEEALARNFVNQITDRVAALFIGQTDDGTDVIAVRFSGFNDIGQLLAAEQMLQQQGQVYRVHLASYQRGVAEFSVQVNGGAAWLAQALEFERRVQRIAANDLLINIDNSNDDDSQSSSVLEYRWLR